MAINKYTRAALRALSYPDIDVKQHYELVRAADKIAHPLVPNNIAKKRGFTLECDGHAIQSRLYLPQERKRRPELLLFFHGGGWIHGDIDSYDAVCASMARNIGCRVLSVDYRLAPEHRFPAGLADCYAVAKKMFCDAPLSIKPEDIVLIGDSAGGNLAAALSLMARDRGEFMPSRQVLIYPSTAGDHDPLFSPFASLRDNGTDFLLTTKRICDYMDLYRSKPEDMLNPYFAPLASQDLTRQPATLIVTAQYDPLRDEGEAYGARLLSDGNRVIVRRMPDALHGFFSLPFHFSQVRHCYRHIEDFLNEVKT